MAIPTFYNSSDAGAPVVYKHEREFLSKILTPCLISGYGSKTAAGWTNPYPGTVGTTNSVGWFNNRYSVLTMPQNSAAYAPGTGDYTLEFWTYLESIRQNTWVDTRISSNNAFQFNMESSGAIILYENAAVRISAAGAMTTTGVWSHLAVCRASGVTRVFKDGTQIGSDYTASTNITNCVPTIGNGHALPSNDYLHGALKDLRLVIGTALYTTSFTTPTAALTAISNTRLLLNFNGEDNSMVITDSSTVGATVTNTGNNTISLLVTLTNQIPPPIGSYDPTTTHYTTYTNAAGKTLVIRVFDTMYSRVSAYNTITSQSSGTQAFIPPDLPPAATNWHKMDPVPAVNTATATLEWKVIATDETFYILLKSNDQFINNDLVYANRGGVVQSISDGWVWYGFGKVGDSKIPISDHFLPMTSQTVYNGTVYNALGSFYHYGKAALTAGGAIVTNGSGLFRFITTPFINKLNPYRAIGYLDYQASSLFENPPAGNTTIKIKSNKHLSALTKIPLVIFGCIGVDLKGYEIGSLPGVYAFKSGEAINVKTGDEITVTTLNGQTLQLMAITPLNSYNITGPQDNTGVFFINKGDWT